MGLFSRMSLNPTPETKDRAVNRGTTRTRVSVYPRRRLTFGKTLHCNNISLAKLTVTRCCVVSILLFMFCSTTGLRSVI